MDALVELFDQKVAFVKSQSSAPSPQQLAQFLRATGAEASPIVAHCPADVQRVVREGFASIGWNLRANASASTAPPTAKAVLAMLEATADFVTSYEAWLQQNVEPTPDELASVAAAAERLWEIDALNRLVPGVDYTLDLQAETKVWQTVDVASRPLFRSVRAAVLKRELWAKFLPLLDRYHTTCGTRERRGPEERRQEDAFLNAALRAPCMRFAHAWLVKKRKAPAARDAFEKLVADLWCGGLSRPARSLGIL